MNFSVAVWKGYGSFAAYLSETLQTCSNPAALCNAFVAGTGLGSPPGPVL